MGVVSGIRKEHGEEMAMNRNELVNEGEAMDEEE